ncbi:hypothetical protein ABKN59_001985 [Abortiporus biennis]
MLFNIISIQNRKNSEFRQLQKKDYHDGHNGPGLHSRKCGRLLSWTNSSRLTGWNDGYRTVRQSLTVSMANVYYVFHNRLFGKIKSGLE